jgi:hypothetical protein
MNVRWRLGIGLGAAAILVAACATMGGKTVNVALSGAEEVPPVATSASGQGSFTVGEDKSVSGSITVKGLSPFAAHIHTGARGANGPVAIGLEKSVDAGWAVPKGAKFTDAQYEAFKAGNTYVNVHTPANKGGEIRGQLRP